MSTRSGLLRARGQIMFLIGLILATGIVMWLNRLDAVPASDVPPAPRFIYVAPADAKRAWQYVESNRNPATGLVNSNHGSGWTTIGDVGHALQATLAAHRLGLINGREMYERIDAVLRTTAALPPASARIDARTGRAIAAENTGDAHAMISALELIAWSYPANSPSALGQLDRWRKTPPAVAPSQPTELERNARLLVRAALATRGDH
jgi:hypothetical protein